MARVIAPVTLRASSLSTALRMASATRRHRQVGFEHDLGRRPAVGGKGKTASFDFGEFRRMGKIIFRGHAPRLMARYPGAKRKLFQCLTARGGFLRRRPVPAQVVPRISCDVILSQRGGDLPSGAAS